MLKVVREALLFPPLATEQAAELDVNQAQVMALVMHQLRVPLHAQDLTAESSHPGALDLLKIQPGLRTVCNVEIQIVVFSCFRVPKSQIGFAGTGSTLHARLKSSMPNYKAHAGPPADYM